MTRAFARFTLASAIVLALFSVSVWGQGGTGALAGTVTDAQGAVIANAKLELTNSATGEKESQTTTGAGTYRFAPLSIVGTYTLIAEAPGFKRYQVSGIIVSVGTVVNRNIQLEVGASGETVNVEATAQLVQTTESQVSQLVDSRVWAAIPLETRTQNTFINLLAGVVPDDQAGSTRGAAVNGARGGTGNFLVEGFDNNDQGQGGRGAPVGPGGAIASISPEAIQEYRVITNSFNAEYGKGGGFVNDTVLKSGTNSYHGSLFWYNRVQALAANDFFSNREGVKDALVRNQGGGSFGGPLIKDKTFFYGSVEIHRLRQSTPLTATATTQEFLDFVNSGAFQTFIESDPNGMCNNQAYLDSFLGDGSLGSGGAAAPCAGAFANSGTIGPITGGLLATQPFPLATSNFTNVGAGLYTGGTILDCLDFNAACTQSGVPGADLLVYPVPVYGDVTVINPGFLNENRFSGKVDHRISDKDQISGTYLFQDADSGTSFDGSDTTIGTAFINPNRTQLAGITWTHTFSPTVVNQARVSYLRHRSDFPNLPGLEDIPSIVTGIDPLGVGLGMTSNLPQFFTDNQFLYKDDISFVRGKHTFKAGGEYRRTRNGSSFEAIKNGLFLPHGVEELLTDGFFGDEADLAIIGIPFFGGWTFAQASVNPQNGERPIYYRGYRANEFAFYFQDEWRASNRLTFNLGLRWEYFGVPHNFISGLDSNYFFGSGSTPIGVVTSNPFYPNNNPISAMVFNGDFELRDSEVWAKDKNNFAPRVGLAWDVFGTGKFVVRSGFGIGYDRIWNNLFENIRFNAPLFSFATVGAFGNGIPAGPLSTPGLFANPFTPTETAGFNNPAFNPAPSPRHMDENLETAYYESANLGIQWEFAKDFALESNYIVNLGRQLHGVIDINTYNGRLGCPSSGSRASVCVPAFLAGDIATSTFSTRRVKTTLAGDNFRTNFAKSNYHALQLIVRKRFSHGLQFNANYTYAKALDDISDAFNARAGLRPTDNENPQLDYGNADFDIRHRFVLSSYYELPFFKGNNLLGGWGISGVVSVQGGVPIALFNSSTGSGDTNRDGYATDRLAFLGSGSLNTSRTGDSPADGYFDTSLFGNFACPASENFGIWCNSTMRRGGLTGPGFRNADLGVQKKFKVTEKVAVQFQANFFNVFNHPNFLLRTANRNSGTFGRSLSTFGDNGGHRITQLALRIDF